MTQQTQTTKTETTELMAKARQLSLNNGFDLPIHRINELGASQILDQLNKGLRKQKTIFQDLTTNF